VQFCGRIERRKAPEILVDAVTILRSEIPNIQARFAGAYYTDPATGMPLMHWTMGRSFDNCHFHGHLQSAQIAEAFRSCRVLVQASRYESFGLAAAQAMAAGRPVVVTSTTGIAKIVREARAGEIVPPGDACALANALRPYLANASYAAEVGERGRRAAIREMDPNRIASIREQVYRDAIQSFHRRRTIMSRERIEKTAAEG
jgi:glycosyltransferase involved in cell wall biosynthesis